MEGFLNLILEPIKEVYLKFKLFFPSFLAMLTIVVIGIAIAWAVKKLMLKIFKAANFDSWCDRMGFTALLRKAGRQNRVYPWEARLHMGECSC